MSEHEHQSFIKTPKQLIAVVVLSFVAPVLIIIMLTQLVVGSYRTDPSALTADAVRERIRPVAGFNLVDANAPRTLKTGQQVFDTVCAACHGAASAIPGSPKIGDNKAWAPLIKEGLATITADAIKGVRAMPPRGGDPDLSDIELQRAIVYIANKSGANWKEPGDGATKPATASGGPSAKVYFDTGKAAISADGMKAIEGVAGNLKTSADAKVDITGYTDKSGNREQNLALARDRAVAVRAALENAGIGRDRINMRPPVEITGSGGDAEARRVELNLAK